jgi:hypothetical protein
MYVLFMYNLSLLILYISYFCNVFKYFPFSFSLFLLCPLCLLGCHMYIIHSIYLWFEYPELPLLLLTAFICSLYLVWHILSLCSLYFNGKSRHLIWCMPLFSHLSICEYGLIMFCIVFQVLNYIFIGVSLKSFVVLFISFPLYMKVTLYFYCYGLVFPFCVCLVGCFLIQFMLYLLLCGVFITYSSFSFASSEIG